MNEDMGSPYFGLATIKEEGKCISYDTPDDYVGPLEDTTYVERRVPLQYEEEVHALITKFLESKGWFYT